MFAKTWNTCQQFKNRNILYVNLPPNDIAELTPWDSVYVDLIGPYSKSIRQQQPGGAIIWNNVCLTWITMTDPATGWFEIFKIPTFDLDGVTSGNDGYIDKLSTRVSHLFNSTCLCIYLRPHKVVFDNGSEFKEDFTPFLKDFDIKPVLTTIKNPQANALVE